MRARPWLEGSIMTRRIIIWLFVLSVAIVGQPNICAKAATASSTAADNALFYLQGQQQTDGSYVDFDGTINATIGVALAVSSTGRDANAWKKANASVIDYLASQKSVLSDPAKLNDNTAKIAQLVMVLVASGNNPRAFAGEDWVALLKSTQNGTTGAFGSSFIQHPWAMMAIKAAGDAIPGNAVTYLTDNQEGDGGFGFNGKGSGSDTNSTALGLEALAAAGWAPSTTAIQQALAYLHTQQNDDGGFPWSKVFSWGKDSDASSTSWVIQGLIAAGEDPQGSGWTKNGQTPVDYLISMQNANGAFGYQASWSDDNLMSTYQAIPALAGKAFPLELASGGPNLPVVSPGSPSTPATQPVSETGTGSLTGSIVKKKQAAATLASAMSPAGTGSLSSNADSEKANIKKRASSKNPRGVMSLFKKNILNLAAGFLIGSLTFAGIILVGGSSRRRLIRKGPADAD